jgi:hypothetical protein
MRACHMGVKISQYYGEMLHHFLKLLRNLLRTALQVGPVTTRTGVFKKNLLQPGVVTQAWTCYNQTLLFEKNLYTTRRVDISLDLLQPDTALREELVYNQTW